MSIPGNEDFRPAFEQIATAAAKAREIQKTRSPHQNLPTEPNVVEKQSEAGEVTAIVEEAEIRSLAIDEMWMHGTDAYTVEELVRKTVNEALRAWNEEELERLKNITPAMQQLTNLLADAGNKVDQAFANRMKMAEEM